MSSITLAHIGEAIDEIGKSRPGQVVAAIVLVIVTLLVGILLFLAGGESLILRPATPGILPPGAPGTAGGQPEMASLVPPALRKATGSVNFAPDGRATIAYARTGGSGSRYTDVSFGAVTFRNVPLEAAGQLVVACATGFSALCGAAAKRLQPLADSQTPVG